MIGSYRFEYENDDQVIDVRFTVSNGERGVEKIIIKLIRFLRSINDSELDSGLFELIEKEFGSGKFEALMELKNELETN